MIEITEILTLLQSITIFSSESNLKYISLKIYFTTCLLYAFEYKFFCFTDLNGIKFADYPAENQQRALSRIHREEMLAGRH